MDAEKRELTLRDIIDLEEQMRGSDVVGEIINERKRQDEKWGVQDHPQAAWLVILMEEVGEAAKATLDSDANVLRMYRAEMIQVAAVAVAAVESLDRQRRRTLKKYPVLVVAESVRTAQAWIDRDKRDRMLANDGAPVTPRDYRIVQSEVDYVGFCNTRIVYTGTWWQNSVTNQPSFLQLAGITGQSPPGYS